MGLVFSSLGNSRVGLSLDRIIQIASGADAGGKVIENFRVRSGDGSFFFAIGSGAKETKLDSPSTPCHP